VGRIGLFLQHDPAEHGQDDRDDGGGHETGARNAGQQHQEDQADGDDQRTPLGQVAEQLIGRLVLMDVHLAVNIVGMIVVMVGHNGIPVSRIKALTKGQGFGQRV